MPAVAISPEPLNWSATRVLAFVVGGYLAVLWSGLWAIGALSIPNDPPPIVGQHSSWWIVGSIAVVVGWVAVSTAQPRSSESEKALWPWKEGLGVLTRGVFLGHVVFPSLAAFSLVTLGQALSAPVDTLGTLVVLLLLLSWVNGRLLSPYGVGIVRAFGLRPRPAERTGIIGWTLLAWGASIVVYMAVESLFGVASGQPAVSSEHPGVEMPAVVVISGAVLALLFEEMTVRWLLYHVLLRKFGRITSVFGCSAYFVAIHPSTEPSYIAYVFFIGAILSITYERTRSLGPVVLAHGGVNLWLAAASG